MKTSVSRLTGALALCAALSACTTVPGDPYYEPAYYQVYPSQPVYSQPTYIYNQPPLIRPYPAAPPPPVYYGSPHDDDRRGWDHPGRPNDRWHERDHGRDRDRADRDRREREDRDRRDREAQRPRPPERVQPPPPPPPAQNADRVWRDARPPSQGQSAEDGRGRNQRP